MENSRPTGLWSNRTARSVDHVSALLPGWGNLTVIVYRPARADAMRRRGRCAQRAIAQRRRVDRKTFGVEDREWARRLTALYGGSGSGAWAQRAAVNHSSAS